MTLPRLFAAACGILLCVGSAYVFADQRTRRFKALSWFAVGLAMVFAAFRPQVIEFIGRDSTELRIRLVVGFLTFVVMSVTLESVRTGRMQERYAFLWLVTCVLLFAGALFQDVAEFVSRLTGMKYGATVMVVLFAFIMFMLFHFSVALSGIHSRLSQIAQQLAITEQRLRRLQAEISSGQSGSSAGGHAEQ